MIQAIRELALSFTTGFKQTMAYLKLHRALTHFDTEERQRILSRASWLASVVVVLTVTEAASDKPHRQNEPCCARRGNALCILRTSRENGRR